MMNAQTAALILAFTGNAAAYWRMPCEGVSGVARIDPIVDNGKLASHMHTIKGGNALSTACTDEELLHSECTSCQIKQDKSAYWTPQLYFMHESGEVEAVGETGHVTYYKYAPATVNGKLTEPVAMPNGLRVVSGDTLRRNFTLPVPDPDISSWSGEDSTQDALAQKAIGFNCLNYDPTRKPEDTLYRHFMPDKEFLDRECKDGLRLEVLFPYCWNGELDSDDHKSHMAFPSSGQNGGNCPEGYDTVVNQILFETIYPTHNYADKSGYFALSNGDPTGFGYHGDLFVAWDEGVLQEATEKCGDPNKEPFNGEPEGCSVFELISQEEQQECKIKIQEEELKYDMKSLAEALPGTNPIQKGPERATKASSGGKDTPVTKNPTKIEPTIVPSLAYSEGHSAGYTDKVGNIFKQEKSSEVEAPKPSEKAQEQENDAPSAPANVESTVTTSVAHGYPMATPPAAAAEVEAPAGEDSQQGYVQAGLPAVTTIYETSGHAVIEKVIVKTDVTVTAGSAETPAPLKRRHAHHLHQHQQGGRFARR